MSPVNTGFEMRLATFHSSLPSSAEKAHNPGPVRFTMLPVLIGDDATTTPSDTARLFCPGPTSRVRHSTLPEARSIATSSRGFAEPSKFRRRRRFGTMPFLFGLGRLKTSYCAKPSIRNSRSLLTAIALESMVLTGLYFHRTAPVSLSRANTRTFSG